MAGTSTSSEPKHPDNIVRRRRACRTPSASWARPKRRRRLDTLTNASIHALQQNVPGTSAGRRIRVLGGCCHAAQPNMSCRLTNVRSKKRRTPAPKRRREQMHHTASRQIKTLADRRTSTSGGRLFSTPIFTMFTRCHSPRNSSKTIASPRSRQLLFPAVGLSGKH